ncbi:hypothetical protein Ahy_B07g088439 [Arachis hypogaea]|uniref:HpcH/HpaI aldolase/citrate lyase domain-containing protein n=1 Tax=Arachis hypogaea TaxID=3818 RepID=A0A444YEG1_ARAHY|nr:hypothetical protein Ahy_B07g088439 [Arachis hypogaea]
MEHGHGRISDALSCLHAFAATGTAAILQVPKSSATWAKKSLDLGPQGIMFLMIDSTKSAIDIVSFCQIPPIGIRGSAHFVVRASGYDIDEGYLAALSSPSHTLALCTGVSSSKPFLPPPGSAAEAFFPASTNPAAPTQRSLLPSDSEHGPSSAEAFFPVPTEPPSTAQPSRAEAFFPAAFLATHNTAQHSTDHRATQPPIQVRYGARASESGKFIMDNSPITGRVNTTTVEKQRLAKSSLSFNCKK